ncbi:MAG: hypothetical protein AAF220_10690 [Pseudomonadota bacterium]
MSNIIGFTTLNALSDQTLRALYRRMQNQAATAVPGSLERQVALANLDSINRVLQHRLRPKGPGLQASSTLALPAEG